MAMVSNKKEEYANAVNCCSEAIILDSSAVEDNF